MGDLYVLLPAVTGIFFAAAFRQTDIKRKEDAMPKKVTLEDKIAKCDRLLEQIERSRVEIQPKVDAYNAIDAEIKADLEQLERKKRDTVYDHVMSVFGEDISPEEFAVKFDRIMNDNRNKNFIQQLKREQAERKKLKDTPGQTTKSPEALPTSGEKSTTYTEQNNEVLPASDKAVS